MHIICPHCHNPIELVETLNLNDIACPTCGSTFSLVQTPTTHWTPKDGQLALGRFQLLGVLGSGAFGTVYKARDPQLDRIVALKVPRRGNVPEGEQGARFLREARSAAQLHHPAIVPIFEVRQVDGVPYLVSEFIDGVTLADKLSGSALAPKEAARLLVIIAQALDHAHHQGVIHRDVKPSNIMIDTKGQPFVMDFGLAKRAAGEISMTMEGEILGTPAYMSPEQARGELSKVDARSDVYSLGAVLYQMLTGELPFRGNVRMLLYQVQHEDPRPPRSLNDRIPRDLQTICLKAMAKDPARRYQQAGHLAADLERFLRGEPIKARPVGRAERWWRWCRRNPALAATSAAALASLVLVAILSLIFGQSQYRAANEIRDEQKKTKAALEESQRLSATLTLDQGLANCDKGEVGQGMLWLVRALEIAPEEAEDLRRVIRINLAAWRPQLQELQMILPHPQAVVAVAFSPDGSRVLTACADGKARLWDLGKSNLVAEMPHKEGVSFAMFTPNGKVIVTGSEDNTIRVWDGISGRSLGEPLPQKATIVSLAVSPDSKWVAAGLANGAAQVWDLATGQEVGKPVSQPDRVRCVGFSPDSSTLVTAAYGVVCFWEVGSGKLLRKFGPNGNITTFAFSPNGKYFVVGGREPSAQLWDLETGKPAGPTYAHDMVVNHLAISPDSKTLLTGSDDRTARLWDLASGKLIATLVHSGSLCCVAFSPDGKAAVTGSLDGTARLWNATTGQPLGTPLPHGTFVNAVAFSPDSKRLLTGSEDGRARLWDAVTPARAVQELKADGSIEAAAFSPDSKTVVVGGLGNTAKLWSVDTGKLLGQPLRHGDSVFAVAFTPDSKMVLTGSQDRTAQLWDAGSGEPIGQPLKHPGTVGLVAFCPDGNNLLTECHDEAGTWSEVRLWDTKTRMPRGAIMKQPWVDAVAFRPDGKVLVTAGGSSPNGVFLSTAGSSVSGQAQLWDAVTGEPLGKPMLQKGLFWTAAFSPDGTTLLTASSFTTATLWDAAGQPLRSFHHQGPVTAAAFRTDGKAILTASNDRTARQWELASGQPLGSPMLHPTFVMTAVYSPDGRTVLTGCMDGSGRLWDAGTSKPLGPPLLHQNFVHLVAISPDGQTLLTAGGDDKARLWPMPRPWNDAPEEINRWLEVTTGLTLDREHGVVVNLDAETWQQRREELATKHQ